MTIGSSPQRRLITYESLTDRVMAEIRSRIASGDYAPGTLYSTYQVSEWLGVSRSPVREALLRLSEDGIVRLERNRGFYVTRPEASDLREIFDIRLRLELPAVVEATRVLTTQGRAELRRLIDRMGELAAEGDKELYSEQDRAMHDLILGVAGNARARSVVDRLRTETRLLGVITVDFLRTLPDLHDEHVPIVEAIERGAADAARDAMRDHLESTRALMIRQVGGEPTPKPATPKTSD